MKFATMKKNFIGKKERRKERYLRRKANDESYKREMWESGRKLIEPEWSGHGFYPSDYSIELGRRLREILVSYKSHTIEVGDVPDRENPAQVWTANDRLRLFIGKYRPKLRDFILLYNPQTPESSDFAYIKSVLECYWDEPEKLIEVV